jgi:hypothetical protein
MSLEDIAKLRYEQPLSTWPDHIQRHRLTLFGDFRSDALCLRCWLEFFAGEAAKKELKQRERNARRRQAREGRK